MPAIAGKLLEIAGDKAYKSQIRLPVSSYRVGIPCLCGIKRNAVQPFTATQRFLLIKGGLMEPNGILCEVQPGQVLQFFMLLFIIYFKVNCFLLWPPRYVH